MEISLRPKRVVSPPVRYNRRLMMIICDRIANGEGLTTICRDEGFPSASSVLSWVVNDRDGCAEGYLRARETQAMLLAETLVDIADDNTDDVLYTKNGPTLNKEFVARSTLRIETRKFIIAKILPKVYGTAALKVEHEGTVQINHNLSGVALLLAAAKANTGRTIQDAVVEYSDGGSQSGQEGAEGADSRDD